MANPLPCTWAGVFPAATTQFDANLEAAVIAMIERARDTRPQ